jgi:hypothetical protein
MKKNPFTLFGLLPPRDDKDLTWILRNSIAGILLFTFAMIAFVAGAGWENWVNRVLTFCAVAGACVLCGGCAGFLFGIPRAGKQQLKEDENGVGSHYYSDNTNLEDISDWLTKIIVGLTLVKFRTILNWIDSAATSVSKTLVNQPDCSDNCGKYYVFSYGTILIYLLAGGLMAYLWTRINFSKILTYNRKHLREIEMSESEKAEGLKELNKNLDTEGDRYIIPVAPLKFKEKVNTEYRNRPVKDKTDLQNGRWGGLSSKNGFTLAADVEKKKYFPKLFILTLQIKRTSDEARPQDVAAFFIHDTFPKEIVYVKFDETNVAVLQLTCYEAFTVGAMLEDGSDLELDLNKIPGLPKGFYWPQT